MPRDLGNVIVTGGASGLGAAVVHAVHEHGGCPIIIDRRRRPGRTDQEIADLSDTKLAERAVHRVLERYEQLDAVVTCAGIDHPGRLAEVRRDDWEQVIAVNLLGTAAVVRAAIPALVASHGRIVTVASTLGLRAVSDATAYCASKFGVVGFTRALAAELAGQVGVTLLVPGGMRTAFFDSRTEQYRPPPDADLGDPSDVADAVIFALSRPRGAEARELVVCAAREGSWP